MTVGELRYVEHILTYLASRVDITKQVFKEDATSVPCSLCPFVIYCGRARSMYPKSDNASVDPSDAADYPVYGCLSTQHRDSLLPDVFHPRPASLYMASGFFIDQTDQLSDSCPSNNVLREVMHLYWSYLEYLQRYDALPSSFLNLLAKVTELFTQATDTDTEELLLKACLKGATDCHETEWLTRRNQYTAKVAHLIAILSTGKDLIVPGPLCHIKEEYKHRVEQQKKEAERLRKEYRKQRDADRKRKKQEEEQRKQEELQRAQQEYKKELTNILHSVGKPADKINLRLLQEAMTRPATGFTAEQLDKLTKYAKYCCVGGKQWEPPKPRRQPACVSIPEHVIVQLEWDDWENPEYSNFITIVETEDPDEHWEQEPYTEGCFVVDSEGNLTYGIHNINPCQYNQEDDNWWDNIEEQENEE